MSTITVRDADESDYPVAAALRAANEPDRIITLEGMTAWMGGLPERAALATWVAEDGSEPVGWAMAMRLWTQNDDGLGSVDVAVAPDRHREGIGAALAERIQAHCAGLGFHTVRAMSSDTPATRAMAARYGFREAHGQTMSTVDPRTVEAEPVPDGVRLVPFGELTDPRPLFELDLEVSDDVPGDESFEAMTLDDWTQRFWRSPVVDDECSLVAYVDGELAGLTMLRVDRPTGRAHNNITGVRRAYRGRGLARLLKTHSLHRAGELGVTVAATENDETNGPMLAVNTRLGYRPSSRRVEWEHGGRDA